MPGECPKGGSHNWQTDWEDDHVAHQSCSKCGDTRIISGGV